MPGPIGWTELIIVLVLALLIFGPKRLPEMGRSLGRGLREFKDSVTGTGKDDDEDDDRALPPADDEPEPVTTGRRRKTAP
jgi:sec-independent protein translocase protein TatA